MLITFGVFVHLAGRFYVTLYLVGWMGYVVVCFRRIRNREERISRETLEVTQRHAKSRVE